MSKRTTTRWYIGSWIGYILAVIAFFVIGHNAQGSSSPPPALFIPYAVMAVTGVVMLVMWIGALVKLGQQHASGRHDGERIVGGAVAGGAEALPYPRQLIDLQALGGYGFVGRELLVADAE